MFMPNIWITNNEEERSQEGLKKTRNNGCKYKKEGEKW